MKKTKNHICIDCLSCKVSAKSTANNRLCYCAKDEKRKRHKEPYWFTKKVCDDFEGMD
jgi:hypothetical protein